MNTLNKCPICNYNFNINVETVAECKNTDMYKGCELCGSYCIQKESIPPNIDYLTNELQNPQIRANAIYLNIQNKLNERFSVWIPVGSSLGEKVDTTNAKMPPKFNTIDDAINMHVSQSHKYIELLKHFENNIKEQKLGAFDAFSICLDDIYLCRITSVDEFLKIYDYLNNKNLISCYLTSDQFKKILEKINSYKENALINDHNYIKSEIDKLKQNITIEGYHLIEDEIKRNKTNKVFIAMKFHADKDNYIKSVQDSCREVKPELEANIVSPHHNKFIVDKIINEIRESKFVIADFTPDLNKDYTSENEYLKYKTDGSYFEAGYAFGLGKEVIYTVKKDALKYLHFDIMQINFIIWENYDDLKEQLIDRIKASIKL